VPSRWQVRGGTLSNADHTLVMGVLNVTPDSFSDGGLFLDSAAAIERGLGMWSAGADIIDVGGESTRPGSDPVPADVESGRVIPVIEALSAAGAVISVDTAKASVAAAAIEAGAAIVNDVTSLGDPEMAAVVAATGAGLVLMHMQGAPDTMQAAPHYDDVVAEVTDYLATRSAVAVEAGIAEDAICLDPGIGFGKSLEHNLRLLDDGVRSLAATGRPVLVGASRKSFLEKILGPIPPQERDVASAAAHGAAITVGAALIRVHNVVEGLRAARIVDAIVRADGGV